ncbi:calcium ATPase, partial [Hymenopellis radicata]
MGARTSLTALNSVPTPPVFTSSSVHFNPSPDSLGPVNQEHGRKNSTTSNGPPRPNATADSDPRSSSSDASAALEESPESRKRKGARKRKKNKEVEVEVEEKLTGYRAELQQDLNFDPAPFKFKPYELAHMLDPKSFDTLSSFGGTAGLLSGLGTSKDHGLSKVGNVQPVVEGSGAFSASIEERRRVYGNNILPIRISKTLLELMWITLKDEVIMLSIAAVISLVLGLYQDFGVANDEPPVDWVEGVAIMAAIAVVVVVGSVNDWQKEKQFKVLNEKKEERGVKVIRDGVETIVDVKAIVVGDIAVLEPGEIVPCDGIFLGGHNVKCDESGATGESDAIKKMTFEECIKAQSGEKGELAHTDCFIISGSKVLEGVGKYVIVAVGTKSFNGRIMMVLRGAGEQTPLQRKLNDLAQLIAKLGFIAGLILFTIMMIRFFVQLGAGEPKRTSNEKAIVFANILVVAVALVVVAVPEGLPLAVTLALAFATKRMTYENILVRVLGSCETMANASVVCTDKTGTLTQNDMTVVA